MQSRRVLLRAFRAQLRDSAAGPATMISGNQGDQLAFPAFLVKIRKVYNRVRAGELDNLENGRLNAR